MYINPYFRSGIIDYDRKRFINTGILYTWRESTYPKYPFWYGVLSLFVNSPPEF